MYILYLLVNNLHTAFPVSAHTSVNIVPRNFFHVSETPAYPYFLSRKMFLYTYKKAGT